MPTDITVTEHKHSLTVTSVQLAETSINAINKPTPKNIVTHGQINNNVQFVSKHLNVLCILHQLGFTITAGTAN